MSNRPRITRMLGAADALMDALPGPDLAPKTVRRAHVQGEGWVALWAGHELETAQYIFEAAEALKDTVFADAAYKLAVKGALNNTRTALAYGYDTKHGATPAPCLNPALSPFLLPLPFPPTSSQDFIFLLSSSHPLHRCACVSAFLCVCGRARTCVSSRFLLHPHFRPPPPRTLSFFFSSSYPLHTCARVSDFCVCARARVHVCLLRGFLTVHKRTIRSCRKSISQFCRLQPRLTPSRFLSHSPQTGIPAFQLCFLG